MPIQERHIAWDEKGMLTPLDISAQSRAFRFGDGVFESILVREGLPLAMDLHMKRILKGATILGFELQNGTMERRIEALVEKLLKGQDDSDWGRMRITASRAGGGTYLPTSNHFLLRAEITPLPSDPWRLQPPKRLCMAHAYPLSHSALSAAKTLNALPYVLAALHAQRQGYDDALLRHCNGEIAELSASNLFVFYEGRLHTPRLASGCLPGTMRERVCNMAASLGIELIQEDIYIGQLSKATEAFCTNAIQGIQPIGEIDETTYQATEFPVMNTLRNKLIQ